MRHAIFVWLMASSVCVADVLASEPVTMHADSGVVQLSSGPRDLTVSLYSPRFVTERGTISSIAPSSVRGDLARGERVELAFPVQELSGTCRLECKVFLEWSPAESVLRKWAAYRWSGIDSPLLVSEIVLEEIELSGLKARLLDRQPVMQRPASYPVFLAGFFAGVEFPVASTRIESTRAVIAHQPGMLLEPGTWRETRKAVFGIASGGKEWDAFVRYIEARRPFPHGRHANYNHWWSTPTLATEADILGLMDTFQSRLYQRHGVAFDTFCIDVGWARPDSVWEMDNAHFPAGFALIGPSAARMGTSLGLWVSPSSVYALATNLAWLREHGYETAQVAEARPARQFACLGGKRYQTRFKERLLDMVRRYELRSIKFDGYVATCPAADHGHAPGDLAAEAIADGMIDVFHSLREAQPDIWLRPTCFGWNPSPWWLFYTNSVIGAYGDDFPYGRVPSPVARESYTSARDYFNLQGAWRSPLPLAAEEILGICHQTDEPFLNDAVMVIMRGHSYVPLYLNPKFMDDRRWAMLASLLQWSRQRHDALDHPRPLLPPAWQDDGVPHFTNETVMPRQPYGYAHDKSGLVVLRNPWIAPACWALRLPETASTAAGAGNLTVASIYPEARCYGRSVKCGDTLNIMLAPYETLVLSISDNPPIASLPEASGVVGGRLTVADGAAAVATRIAFDPAVPAFGREWTSPMGDTAAGVRVTFRGSLRVQAPEARLVAIAEGPQSPKVFLQQLTINGQKADATIQVSDSAWAASTIPPREHWTMAHAPLQPGDNQMVVELIAGEACAGVSLWVWATRPGSVSTSVGAALPEPELISLDAVCLLPTADVASLGAPAIVPRPVERIDGVFLDAMDPVSAEQGWGTLQRNRSVWEKPLSIGGQDYLRGIGVSSRARIVYSLDRQYRRFQAWVGADGATAPSVTFAVQLDGRQVWESGLMVRDTPAKRVDIDVSGAGTLELIVGDGGDGITSDHADWADARLLR